MSKEIKLEDDEVISANELYKRWRDKEIGISNCVSLVKLAYDKKLIKSYKPDRPDVQHGKFIKYYIEVKPFHEVQCDNGDSFFEFNPSGTYFKLEDVRLAEREMLGIEPPDADNGEKTDAATSGLVEDQPSPGREDGAEIARLKAELEVLRSSFNGLQSEAEQARAALKNAEAERDNLRVDLERTKENLKAAEDALETMTTEHDRLAMELDAMRQNATERAGTTYPEIDRFMNEYPWVKVMYELAIEEGEERGVVAVRIQEQYGISAAQTGFLTQDTTEAKKNKQHQDWLRKQKDKVKRRNDASSQ